MKNKHTRSVSLIDGHTEDITATEIINALNGADGLGHISIYCADNNGEDVCSIKLGDIIDLINRQKAENERLRGLMASVRDDIGKAIISFDKDIAIAKAEAIKEFAERLTDTICNKIEQSSNNPDGNTYFITDVYRDIDNLVKEMTEVSE